MQDPNASPDQGLNADGSPIQSVQVKKQADNTGRDWGEGAAMGGSIIGSILSFGAAAPAAVAVGADIAADSIEDAQQNDQDKQNQALANANQGKAQAAQTNQAVHAGIGAGGGSVAGSGAKLGANADSGVIGNPAGMSGGVQTQQQLYDAQRPQESKIIPGLMHDPSEGGMNGPWISPYAPKSAVAAGVGVRSDRRVKKNVTTGNSAAANFLEAVRRRGAWPKGSS